MQPGEHDAKANPLADKITVGQPPLLNPMNISGPIQPHVQPGTEPPITNAAVVGAHPSGSNPLGIGPEGVRRYSQPT